MPKRKVDEASSSFQQAKEVEDDEIERDDDELSFEGSVTDEEVEDEELEERAKLPEEDESTPWYQQHKNYDMWHVAQTPSCLSFDVIHDNLGLARKKYPLSCTIAAGSSCGKKNQNHLILIKASHLCRTRNDVESDDDEDESESEDEENEVDVEEDSDDDDSDPIMLYEQIPVSSAINRVRVYEKDPNLIACWHEDGHARVYNVRDHLMYLNDTKQAIGQAAAKRHKQKNQCELYTTTGNHHQTEGFAIAWNTAAQPRLATGDNNGKLNVLHVKPDGFSVTELAGHSKAIEDIQWSPTEENGLATCSVDGTVAAWDLRSGKMKWNWQASGTDVNVISWNKIRNFMMATGDDEGVVSVWDMRILKSGGTDSIAKLSFLKEPVTSVEWSPVADSVIMASDDKRLTVWDLSVENDAEAEMVRDEGLNHEEQPSQLLFGHIGGCMKESHWHPQVPGLIITTDGMAMDSLKGKEGAGIQFFKPTNWKHLIT